MELIKDELEFHYYRGDYRINKMPNCVRIRHKPTGIVVQECSDRILHINKENAIKELKEILKTLHYSEGGVSE